MPMHALSQENQDILIRMLDTLILFTADTWIQTLTNCEYHTRHLLSLLLDDVLSTAVFTSSAYLVNNY